MLRPLHKRAVSSVIILAIGLSSTAEKAKAEADRQGGNFRSQLSPNPGRTDAVSLYQYRDSDQRLVDVMYQPAPPEVLRQFAPSSPNYKELLEKLQRAQLWDGAKKAPGKLLSDLPIELLIFNTALAISTAFHSSNDPAWVKHYVEHNFSILGMTSFAGFIGGSRSAQATMAALRLAYDWRWAPVVPVQGGKELAAFRWTFQPGLADILGADNWTFEPRKSDLVLEKRFRDGFKGHVAEAGKSYPQYKPQPPTKLQRMFAPLVGPLALGSGLIVSNVINEIAADKNIQLCAKKMNSRLPPSIEMANACDRAWDDWALSKKLADYAPDIVALGGVAFIQQQIVKPILKATSAKVSNAYLAGLEKLGIYVLDSTTGAMATGESFRAVAVKSSAEKYIPVVLKSLRFGQAMGRVGGGPTWHVVSSIGHLVMFMEAIHWIGPVIKMPFQKWRLGHDIADRINTVQDEIDRVEKNGWVWTPKMFETYSTGPMGEPSGTEMVDSGLPKPSILLKHFAEKQAKWRELILQDANTAKQNWSDYVGQFTTMYSNAYSFYRAIAADLNRQRLDPDSKDRPAKLFQESPLNGVNLFSGQELRRSIVEVAFAVQWLREYLKDAADSSRRLPGIEAKLLPEILADLRYYGPEVPLEKVIPDLPRFRGYHSLSADEKIDVEFSYRRPYLERALVKIRNVLANDPIYNDNAVDWNTDSYKQAADRNPFMKLRMLMGMSALLGPGPKAAKQWLIGYLKARANNPNNPLFPVEERVLPKVLKSLDADDPTIPMEKIFPGFPQNLREFRDLTPDQEKFEMWKLRDQVLAEGVALLHEVLQKDPKFNDRRFKPGTPEYADLAKWNPFAKVRILLGNAEPLGAGISVLRAVNNSGIVIEQETKDNFPHHVGFAGPRSMVDYLLTSMVCGPEADLRLTDQQKLKIYRDSQRSSFDVTARPTAERQKEIDSVRVDDARVLFEVERYKQSVTNPKFLLSKPFDAPSKDAVMFQFHAIGAFFRPPKIISGVDFDFCGQKQNVAISPNSFDIHKATWTINGQTYNGMLDVVKKHARAEFIGTALIPEEPDAKYQSPATLWWEKHIEPHAQHMIEEYRQEYKRIVFDLFIPAVYRATLKTDGLLPSMLHDLPEPDIEYRGHRFAVGAMESLQREVRFYTVILGKTSKVAKPPINPIARDKFVEIANNVIQSFYRLGMLPRRADMITAKNSVADELFSKERSNLEAALKELENWVTDREFVIKSTEDQKAMNKQLLRNLTGLMGEIETYWAVIRAIKIAE